MEMTDFLGAKSDRVAIILSIKMMSPQDGSAEVTIIIFMDGFCSYIAWELQVTKTIAPKDPGH